MDDRHFSEDELLDRLFGISSRSDSHLDACAECRASWNVLSKARAAELRRTQLDLPESFLMQQRMNVMNRIERRVSRNWLPGPAPALALAMLCAIAVLLVRPAPAPVEVSDAQFFSEVYSVAESTQPNSAAPIQNLFQGEQP